MYTFFKPFSLTIFCFVLTLTNNIDSLYAQKGSRCLPFLLNVTITNTDSLEVEFSYDNCYGKKIKTIKTLKKGKTVFRGYINKVSNAMLLTDVNVFSLDDSSIVKFILEPTETNLVLTIDSGVAKNIKLTGAKIQQEKIQWEAQHLALFKRYRELKSLSANDSSFIHEYSEFRKKIVDTILIYVSLHPNSYHSGYLLSRYSTWVSKDVLKKYFYILTQNIRNSSFGNDIFMELNPPSKPAIVKKDQQKKSDKKFNTFYDVYLPDTNGNKQQLSVYRGHPVVLVFWASWCGPCKKELPYSNAVFDSLKNRQVPFLSVSIDEDRNKWITSLKKYPFPGNNLIDSDKILKEFFPYVWIPQYVVIDANGKLVDENIHFTKNPSELLRIVDKLLK